MAKPHGELTKESLGTTIRLLKEAGVSDAEVADTLFLFAKTFATPSDIEKNGAVVAWYTQLQRYRDDLNDQIARIEDAMGAAQN